MSLMTWIKSRFTTPASTVTILAASSYTELYGLWSNAEFRNRVAVACIVAADTIRTEPTTTANHANRMLWAKTAFMSPSDLATRMVMAVVAQNKAISAAQILAATDSTMQTAVLNAVDVFATGA
jgi:nicotinic acid phosphoribosyltransferase